MSRCLLFDLDGTLTDPAEGILGGVVYALEKEALPVPERDVLLRFIGPPLAEQFRLVCGVSPRRAAALVAAYREYYVARGMWENRVYPGIPELLAALRAAGCRLGVATSKPEPFAEQILAHFRLRELLDFVCGSTLDESRSDKAAVIAYALESQGLGPRDRVVMVGDRCYDAAGAAANGLPCVGVLYGYGSREELVASGVCAVADTVKELQELLLAL